MSSFVQRLSVRGAFGFLQRKGDSRIVETRAQVPFLSINEAISEFSYVRDISTTASV